MSYRSENGKLAAGVPKKFSEAEIRARTERLALARKKRLRLLREPESRLEDRKRLVKAMAQDGKFVPMDSWE